MKLNIFVNVKVENSRVNINRIIFNDDIEEHYQNSLEFAQQFEHDKFETLEGYKLSFLNIDIKPDRRKKNITDKEVFKELENQNYVMKHGDNIFGGIYSPISKLTDQLETQLNKRRELINNGEFVSLQTAQFENYKMKKEW